MANRRAGLQPGAALATLAALLAGTSVALVPRCLASPIEGIAGWEGDTHRQGYGFATIGALVPAGARVVLPVRITGSYLYYRYDSTGTSIDVRSPGASITAGARLVGSRGSVTASAGVEVRHERRQADPAGSPAREDDVVGFVGQMEADLPLAPRWDTFLLSSYGGAARYVYGRGSLRYRLTNEGWQDPQAFFVGAEGVAQGNRESRAFQGGAMVECALVRQHTSIALHGGYKESWSPGRAHLRGAYFGVGLYQRF